jgi:peptidyl-prolyl cis-trans isomerase D
MQRHKKWLIITIWISTIAFVGAGFVGWGQYKYGDKAGAIAKVGDVEITMGELQKRYSALYNQYSQIFQGNFDEEKAKQFHLQQQALKQLIDQSLILNLAKDYDLLISDTEPLDEIKTQEYFFTNGVFDKELYKQVLSRNNLNMKEYEADVKRQLLIQKVLKLLSIQENENEAKIFNTINNIADKIEYKLLSSKDIPVDTSDENLKPFWENMKNNFMSEVSYEINYITQEKIKDSYNDAKISDYYNDNKMKFKDTDGKIKALEDVKNEVIEKLNKKATKNAALKTYIAFKKGNLDAAIKKQTATISASNNKFNNNVLDTITTLNSASPYTKPIEVDGEFYIFELVKTNAAQVKTYEEAKNDVATLYIQEQKRAKLLDLAQKSLNDFKGTTTDFITSNDFAVLDTLSENEAKEFLKQLFTRETKKDIIQIGQEKVILYHILEQKLLQNLSNSQEDSLLRLKSAMFNEGLIKSLESKYDTEIFIKGL